MSEWLLSGENEHVQIEKTTEMNEDELPVLGLPGDDEQNGNDCQEKDHKEESGGAWHGAHATHDNQVKDEDQQVQQSHHLHDEHARLLCRRTCVHPRKYGWAQVCGGLTHYKE